MSKIMIVIWKWKGKGVDEVRKKTSYGNNFSYEVQDPTGGDKGDKLIGFTRQNDTEYCKKDVEDMIKQFIHSDNEVLLLLHTNEKGPGELVVKALRNLKIEKLKIDEFAGGSKHKIYTELITENGFFQGLALVEGKKFIHNRIFNELWDSCMKKVKKRDIAEYKHRVISLILPLAIDIQGLSEVMKNDAAKAQDYWEEIKNSQGRFSELWDNYKKLIEETDEWQNITSKDEDKKLRIFLSKLDSKKTVLSDHINNFPLARWLENFTKQNMGEEQEETTNNEGRAKTR